MKESARLRAGDLSKEQKKAAAALLGSIRSDKKSKASRINLANRPPEKRGGLTPKLLGDISCSCSAGDALDGHRWDCPRGQAIKRRIKENRDIQTGAKLNSGEGSTSATHGDGWGSF
jgi:hypothetical protein